MKERERKKKMTETRGREEDEEDGSYRRAKNERTSIHERINSL